MSSNKAELTPEEADDFLKEIRRNKEVDDIHGSQSDNVRDLNGSLNLYASLWDGWIFLTIIYRLADQLYTTPTHFLLELIQNADDNSYGEGLSPTISFTLTKSGSKRLMRIDCNETGFTKQNVKAICSIGQSTKSHTDRTRGFIGEKGIGFKSVFKVADKVQISSGPFQFKLDRRATLGMIAPILERFPSEHRLKNHTQILLHLNGKSEFDRIAADLSDLQIELLLFMRKLSSMKIVTPLQEDDWERISQDNNPSFHGETITMQDRTKVLRRHDSEKKKISIL